MDFKTIETRAVNQFASNHYSTLDKSGVQGISVLINSNSSTRWRKISTPVQLDSLPYLAATQLQSRKSGSMPHSFPFGLVFRLGSSDLLKNPSLVTFCKIVAGWTRWGNAKPGGIECGMILMIVTTVHHAILLRLAYDCNLFWKLMSEAKNSQMANFSLKNAKN